MKRTVLVIGAGASGMTAAAAAARGGASVTVIEGMKKPGRKLLLTGSGRCNLTNLDPGLVHRYASDTEGGAGIAADVIRRFGVRETLAFFEELGLHWTERNGYVYPRSGQAQTVLSVLTEEMKRLGVKMKYDAHVQQIFFDRQTGLWNARVGDWCYQADRLILAAGSKAYPSTGSDGSGYTLARMAGHSCLPARPALSGILAADEEKRLLKTAEGARTYGRVRLKAGAAGEVLKEDEGEIQWTAYGLSGIVIFQLSRSVPAAGEAFLEIDLVPDREEEEIRPEIQKTIDHFGGTNSPRRLLEGYVHERVAAYLAEKAGLQDRKEVCAGELARLLKNVRIGVKGVRSFEHAQVCAGGVPLREVSPETLESRISPGLYLAGELLDIDGPCGGYNLQWAWSSGYVAGTQAAAAPGGTGPDAAAGMRKKPAHS